MISVVCVYNDGHILRRYLLPSLDAQSAHHERILIDNTTGAFGSAASALNHASLGVRRKGLLELLMSLGSSYSEDYYDTMERVLRKHAHLPRIYTTCGEYSTRVPLWLQRVRRAPKECYQTLIWRTREWARKRDIPLPWARTSSQTYFNIEPKGDAGECMVDTVLKKVNRPTGELSDFQKKHIPVIDAPESVRADEAFDVSITVGEWVKHPNELGHFIEWIELYMGDVFLARADLGPVLADPKVVFRIRLDESGTLRAVAKCNLHGVWESTKEIAVE